MTCVPSEASAMMVDPAACVPKAILGWPVVTDAILKRCGVRIYRMIRVFSHRCKCRRDFFFSFEESISEQKCISLEYRSTIRYRVPGPLKWRCIGVSIGILFHSMKERGLSSSYNPVAFVDWCPKRRCCAIQARDLREASRRRSLYFWRGSPRDQSFPQIQVACYCGEMWITSWRSRSD
ncbi:uncharacterized protein LY89DRAFT_202603 [Mollisia scopiformis]|uniref:Uncharacterized protein n=1 Tax=Mollisia scopiformis TaxID=149040 RepID=A0A194WYT7_MOLSC|nr:uncharacterized protein LY89DRAFT_202603 [Mollisia scopiformis]KUJ13128.1 hypothetical protein LY89DRAFT_202603 [Mollisia scopiformis]